MFKVIVKYPKPSATRFDVDYYTSQHIPMVRKYLENYGLIATEYIVSSESEDDFFVVSILDMESKESFMSGMKQHGDQINQDISNFTDASPVVSKGRTVKA